MTATDARQPGKMLPPTSIGNLLSPLAPLPLPWLSVVLILLGSLMLLALAIPAPASSVAALPAAAAAAAPAPAALLDWADASSWPECLGLSKVSRISSSLSIRGSFVLVCFASSVCVSFRLEGYILWLAVAAMAVESGCLGFGAGFRSGSLISMQVLYTFMKAFACLAMKLSSVPNLGSMHPTKGCAFSVGLLSSSPWTIDDTDFEAATHPMIHGSSAWRILTTCSSSRNLRIISWRASTFTLFPCLGIRTITWAQYVAPKDPAEFARDKPPVL
mmetsp:Transcript_3450/g.6440  ORF Transcript_3450/g.6440 Transcript_3450/m.6440 type:complete len:274 (-) Transcript_3450:724-1545(-)